MQVQGVMRHEKPHCIRMIVFLLPLFSNISITRRRMVMKGAREELQHSVYHRMRGETQERELNVSMNLIYYQPTIATSASLPVYRAA